MSETFISLEYVGSYYWLNREFGVSKYWALFVITILLRVLVIPFMFY
jgi:hypothetical protein